MHSLITNRYQQSPSDGKVSILMCTFQGEKHLPEQLESIRKQTYQNWQLFVSDDGSTDNTLTILRNFQATLAPGQMEILSGPKKGFANNFMSLLLNPSICGDYYAFSDQDDYWLDDKLHQAILKLTSLPTKITGPAVYASARALVNNDLKLLGTEGGSRLLPSFKNALVQNIAGGNTIVLNNNMREVLLKIGPVNVIAHDWWVYLTCTGVGGSLYYDEKPYLLYRQHENNIIGSGYTFKYIANRLSQFLGGRLRRSIDSNLAALAHAKPLLRKDNATTMDQFISLRGEYVLSRVTHLFKSGIHRQTRLGTLGLLLACLLKLI